MSAGPGHPSLRARIAEALDQLLNGKIGAQTHTDIGNALGHASTTITRRGCALSNWPAEELLSLAVAHDEIGQAVKTYLSGEHVAGDPARVDDDVIESLAALGQLICVASESMRGDRHVSLREARDLLPVVEQAQGLLAKKAKDLAEQIRRGAE